VSYADRFNTSYFAYEAPVDERMTFIRRTYLHLAGAIAAFVALSWLFYQLNVGVMVLRVASALPFGWLLFLGGFVLVGWLASAMAHSEAGQGAQYAGLALYTVIEALIFSPLLYIAARFFPDVLPTAAGITLLTFGGLSVYVLTTKKDFSFLRTALFIGGIAALGVIVAGAIFGFNLGVWFSGAMIIFACAAILYTTSRVLHEYRTDQHVGAALELFAAVALLFWYVLRLMQLRGDD
jgi:FtsH-binding integral membrane protein